MEFIDFVRDQKRMCEKIHKLNSCDSCPFSDYNTKSSDPDCTHYILRHPVLAEKIVKDWADKHPITNEEKLGEVISELFGFEYTMINSLRNIFVWEKDADEPKALSDIIVLQDVYKDPNEKEG